jgi:4-amino-4-deoxy-L-arabinose transferase-like glycosyltransferase
MSEPLYTLLWALCTYIWIVRRTNGLGWFAVSGVLLGAAALVRPSALFFWLILLAYLLTLKDERKNPLRLGAAVVVTACCTALAVAPVIVRDYRIYHTLVLISNNGGVSLYQANNPLAGGGYSEYNDPQVDKLISDPRTEAQGDRLASERAMQYIKTHPAHEVWLAVRKIKSLYAKDDSVIRFSLRARHYREAISPPPQDRVATAFARINNAAYYAFMLFALFGIALCFWTRLRDEVNPGWRLLLGMILYNTAIFAVIGGLDRYRYPTMPFFAVFAGLGIVNVPAVRRIANHAVQHVRKTARATLCRVPVHPRLGSHPNVSRAVLGKR